MAFTMRTSIHGRRLGISSTGAVITGVDSTGGGSTAFDMAAQMWGPAMFETVASEGNITNTGVSVVSSGSTNGSTMILLAPVQGVYKEIHFQTSATSMGLDTTGGVTINSSSAEAAGGGSTSFTISGTGSAGIGGALTLRGVSSTYWRIVASTINISS